MRTVKNVPATKEEVTITCDTCGKVIYRGYGSRRCTMCQDDVCRECGRDDPLDEVQGDYPDIICNRCLIIGKEFIDKVKEVREKRYFDEENLCGEWQRECIKAKEERRRKANEQKEA